MLVFAIVGLVILWFTYQESGKYLSLLAAHHKEVQYKSDQWWNVIISFAVSLSSFFFGKQYGDPLQVLLPLAALALVPIVGALLIRFVWKDKSSWPQGRLTADAIISGAGSFLAAATPLVILFTYSDSDTAHSTYFNVPALVLIWIVGSVFIGLSSLSKLRKRLARQSRQSDH